jgi:DNA repair protein RadC
MNTLYVRETDHFREATSADILQCARTLIGQRFRTGAPVFNRPGELRDFLRLRLGSLGHEVFAVLFLDHRHRLIDYVELFRGTLNGASVHPREVVKESLARNAAAVILVHNHPSGIAEPSQADEFITGRLKDALALLDIRVLDHFIVGESIFSFAEHGLL